MSDEDEDRKVISLTTRTPIPTEPEPESVPEPEPEPLKPDPVDVTLLKQILERVEKGQLGGLVILAGMRDPRTGRVDDICTFDTPLVYDSHPLMFVGALEAHKIDMISMGGEVYDDDED